MKKYSYEADVIADLIVKDFITEVGLKALQYVGRIEDLVEGDVEKLFKIHSNISRLDIKNACFTEIYQKSNNDENKFVENLLSEEKLKALNLESIDLDFDVYYDLIFNEGKKSTDYRYMGTRAYALKEDAEKLDEKIEKMTVTVEIYSDDDKALTYKKDFFTKSDINVAASLKPDEWFLTALNSEDYKKYKQEQALKKKADNQPNKIKPIYEERQY